MKKSMVMIRNITGISPDEMGSLMTLAGLGAGHLLPNAPPGIAKLQELQLQRSQLAEGQSSKIKALDEQIRGILHSVDTRDYLYEQIKAQTGIHVILHLDSSIEPHVQEYITRKLNSIHPDTHINLFYLGGGHGGGHAGKVDDETSGLKKSTVMALVATLQERGMKTDTAVFGSCYSAAFSNYFRDFLNPKGVMLSDSVECGSQNNFLPVMRWIQDPTNKSLFSDEEIQQSQLSLNELQDKFQELTGERPDNELIQNYSQEFASLGSSATLQQLEEITARHPIIQQHIKSLEERSIFKEEIEELSAKFCDVLKKYQENNPNASAEDAYAELENQFPTSKNVINVFRALSNFLCGDATVEDVLSNLTENKNYLLEDATPETLTQFEMGDLRMFQNKNELYKAAQAAVQSDKVTGRVISTRDSSHMMKFNSATGKPTATCLDAFAYNEKMIGILQSRPGVSVQVEHEISDFNDALVMQDFNSRFSAALEASMTHDFSHFKERLEHVKEDLFEQEREISREFTVEELTPRSPSPEPSEQNIDEPLPQGIKVY